MDQQRLAKREVFVCLLTGLVFITACTISGIIGNAAAAEPRPARKTLSDAYQAALVRSETVGIQNELARQADELEKQAKGALFPTILGSATFLRQATPTDVVGGRVFPASQNTVKLSASQPLFRGLRDFAALRQRGSLTEAQNFAIHTAQRQLFYDVATAFYNLLALTQQKVDYQDEIRINTQRLTELQRFLKLGRAQPSEVLTFKASVSALAAQLENTTTQLETAKDVLSFLTGWPRQTAIQDNERLHQAAPDVSSYLTAIDQRPEVRQAISNLQAYEEGLPIARGGHLPSIDADANYYVERSGSLSGVNWDAQISVTIPIFQGGVVQSQIRQAVAVIKQYELLLSQARRNAEQEIRTFFDAFVGGKTQMDKLSATTQLSKESYQATLRDYRTGLVRNIDVLQSLTAYQDAERTFDQQRFVVKLADAKLQAAVGARAELFLKGDRR